MDITELLDFSVKHNASDLHLSAGVSPMVRIDGEVRKLEIPSLEHSDVHRLIFDIMNDKQRSKYDEQLEIAAMPAVLLVLVGLIPLIIVNRSLEQHH